MEQKFNYICERLRNNVTDPEKKNESYRFFFRFFTLKPISDTAF